MNGESTMQTGKPNVSQQTKMEKQMKKNIQMGCTIFIICMGSLPVR